MPAADHRKLNSHPIFASRSVARKLFAAVGLLLFVLSNATAQEPKPTQYDVEAVYLLNFAKFVRWPQTPANNQPFSICVFGDDPFGPALARTISGEKLDGRPVMNKQISSPEEASACSILYIHASDPNRIAGVLSQVQGLPVLTVSDMPNFLERGGIIQFVLIGDRVRFEVNLQPTNQDGLMLSSELLKVAVKVKAAKAGQ